MSNTKIKLNQSNYIFLLYKNIVCYPLVPYPVVPYPLVP